MLSKRRRRAFTLIELMVVVAIMAILAGLIIPLVISRAQKSSAPPAESVNIAQPAPAISGARVVSSTVAVELEVAPILEGTSVRSRYLAAFHGTFVFEGGDDIALYFPFPPGATEVRDVSLSLPGAQYSADGIRWHGSAGVNHRLTAIVAYRAIGRDTLTYDIAGRERTGSVLFTVDVKGGRAIVPSASLEPTEVSPERVVWKFDKMITSRPIVLELPSGSSPLGRAILLLRLAALSVLMFGAGYWYLGEGMRPGHLDSFRWSHFLLLALDYSLYFAVCGVLLFWMSAWAAAAIAAAISFPLLALHMSRIAAPRFAWLRGLPLAMFTIAVTVLAVFAEERRSLVFLGAGIFVVALLTLTHERFTAARRVQRDRNEKGIAASLLAQVIERGETARRAAAHLLEEHSQGAELERTALFGAIEKWTAVFNRPAPDRPVLINEHRERLQRSTADLTAASTAFHEAARVWKKPPPVIVEATHCASCGANVDSGARYCDACGVERPIALSCETCGRRVRLPSQVLRKTWLAASLCCEACGSSLR